MLRDILKYSLHPILKKLGTEGGFHIFRRFRSTLFETSDAGVPRVLERFWTGHSKEEQTRLREIQEAAASAGLAFAVREKSAWDLRSKASRARIRHPLRVPFRVPKKRELENPETFAVPEGGLKCFLVQ